MTALVRVNDLLGGADLRVTGVARDGRGWAMTVAPVPGACGRCGRWHPWPPTTTRLSGADIRNPKRLATLARQLGRPESARPLTAEDGHKLTRLLWCVVNERMGTGNE